MNPAIPPAAGNYREKSVQVICPAVPREGLLVAGGISHFSNQHSILHTRLAQYVMGGYPHLHKN